MNRKEHVLNAALLAIGLGYVLHPSGDTVTFYTIIEVGVPVILGALFPDVDTAFGKHRKTLHNLPVLGLFYVFPLVFGNLEYVWIGVLTHYVLDMLGSKRGLAWFYPYEKEFGAPFGVAVSSNHATSVTLLVTAFEIAVAALLVHHQLVVDAGLTAVGMQ
ncbi:LexA-binding, inner membrane-associated putative hydrolase [Haladaptatus litoreus]|uniref:LexA-binding, inner membrane-associated putative hydrolase n=1 Tax=Haladaptatus litoreus TaxID=553468 RepID=A0A1N6WW11_9EURY|nr:metal-dependent hydrolase [Haladaptatus litoreus]SIQ94201.1 LexA-binding, inner membrane-associated putative hydrolase [Haladaptatus litoreus]